MKKTIIIVLLAAVICVLPAAARKKKSGGTGIPQFAEKVHDFGIIKEKNGPVSCEFEFVNTGDGNLVINDVTAECGCTRPEYPRHPIAPGKKSRIKVTYNPAGRPWSFDKSVTVRTDGKPRKVVLKIRGVVQGRDK